MGYTTDANYLIQAGKDIGGLAERTDSLTSTFDGETVVEWHAWGTVNARLGKAYDELRDEMIAILRDTVVMLEAHSAGLTATGDQYLVQEELAELAFEHAMRLRTMTEQTMQEDR